MSETANPIEPQAPAKGPTVAASAAPPVTAAAPPAAEGGERTVEGRSTEFRAVEGGGETQSGAMLLVEAYAVIWLLVFALVAVTMRRIRRLDERVARLADEVAKARASAETVAPEQRTAGGGAG